MKIANALQSHLENTVRWKTAILSLVVSVPASLALMFLVQFGIFILWLIAVVVFGDHKADGDVFMGKAVHYAFLFGVAAIIASIYSLSLLVCAAFKRKYRHAYWASLVLSVAFGIGVTVLI